MKKQLLLFIAFYMSIFLVTSCSTNDDTADENPNQILEAETLLNVSYGTNSKQVYDLYLPQGRTQENTKVIILVHGGGWTSGDKSDMSQFVNLLRENHSDYAIANINYVLAGFGVPAFPNQFLDLGRVISQLTAQQNELQIQPQFGLIGTSAGAHISLMYDYVYDTSNQVKFVANIVGPTDFTDPFYADDPNFPLALQFLVDASAYPQNANLAETVSPALQVSALSSPTILFYGDQDPIVPLSNGQTLAASLNTQGTANEFTVYQGGHGDDWSQADYLDLQLKLEDFIQIHLPLEIN
ncbi:alpha/beta hydrolase [Paucihalobacter ruber]|uniref:Alpha/beta hydrolase n=1 Tax=Paucihalobacter ruber TaxID=2567861 RepID=A0A506PNR8_9FLAO|nr:alpha/beta hydrolase [Paucihalobacter ruber]TPV34875.1 alpha/beta hydrolase [Paucihalobacter ruber]